MAAVPQPEEAGPDAAGLADSLFHEITSVCDTSAEAFAVVNKLILRIGDYYAGKAKAG